MTDYNAFDHGSREDFWGAWGDCDDCDTRELRGLASLLREQSVLESTPESPDHYKSDGGIECIDAIRAAMTAEEYRGFLRGNALKYIWRCGKKGPAAEDLRKAQTYIGWLISAYEE